MNMNEEYYTNLLEKYRILEIETEELEQLKRHTEVCPSCLKEFIKYTSFIEVFKQIKINSVQNIHFDTERFRLLYNIGNGNKQNEKLSLIESLSDYLNIHRIKYIGYGFALILAGFLIGRFWLFEGLDKGIEKGLQESMITEKQIETSEDLIPAKSNTDIIIESPENKAGSLKYAGLTEDDLKFRLISESLTASGNAGAKLKTFTNIADQKNPSKFILDESIKKVLILAVKNDDNPGVRRQALNLLAAYPYDEEIRDVILFALANDNNAGNRIFSINILSSLQYDGAGFEGLMIETLRNSSKNDNNDFIKLRAEMLLQEASK